MSKWCWATILSSLVLCSLWPALAGAEQPPLTSARLAEMGSSELEALYRQSAAGTIPECYLRGRAIYCPCDKFAKTRSNMTNALWHGKVFDPCTCTLVNQWCGFRAIKARVSYGPSCLDGKPSIIMDYSETSRIWKEVRDEAREVAPGVYLGLMFKRKGCDPEFKLYFTLESAPAPCQCP